MILTIHPHQYEVTQYKWGWELRRGQEVYHVHRTRHGWECTCGHWIWKQAVKGKGCKHIAAVQNLAVAYPKDAPHEVNP